MSKNTVSKDHILRESAVFGFIYDQVQETSRVFQGKVWPLEMLKANVQEFLQHFLESKYTDLSNFFQNYLNVRFSQKDKGLQFCILMFFSVEEHSVNSLEIENLRNLFQNNSHRSYYVLYEKVKKYIFMIKRSRGTAYDSLDEVFLTHQEVLVLSDRVVSGQRDNFTQWIQEQNQLLKQLRKEIRQGVSTRRSILNQKDKHFRKSDVSASALIQKHLQILRQTYIQQQVRQENLMNQEDDQEQIYDQEERLDEVIVVENDDYIIKKSKVDLKKQEEEKEAYLSEIQRLNKETNERREALLKLVGLMHSLDPVSQEALTKAQIVREKLNSLRKKVTTDEQKRQMFSAIGIDGFRFFDKGSKLVVNQEEKMKMTLKKQNLIESRDIINRSGAYGTHMCRYRDSLWNKYQKNNNLFQKKPMNSKEINMANFERMKEGITEGDLNQSFYGAQKVEGLEFDRDVNLQTFDFNDNVIGDNVDYEFQRRFNEQQERERARLAQPKPKPAAPVEQAPPPKVETPPLAIEIGDGDLLEIDDLEIEEAMKEDEKAPEVVAEEVKIPDEPPIEEELVLEEVKQPEISDDIKEVLEEVKKEDELEQPPEPVVEVVEENIPEPVVEVIEEKVPEPVAEVIEEKIPEPEPIEEVIEQPVVVEPEETKEVPEEKLPEPIVEKQVEPVEEEPPQVIEEKLPEPVQFQMVDPVEPEEEPPKIEEEEEEIDPNKRAISLSAMLGAAVDENQLKEMQQKYFEEQEEENKRKEEELKQKQD